MYYNVYYNVKITKVYQFCDTILVGIMANQWCYKVRVKIVYSIYTYIQYTLVIHSLPLSGESSGPFTWVSGRCLGPERHSRLVCLQQRLSPLLVSSYAYCASCGCFLTLLSLFSAKQLRRRCWVRGLDIMCLRAR